MKTEHEIIETLKIGKKLSLFPAEKDAIKATLMAHANESLRHENVRVRTPWITWLLRSSAAFASIVFIAAGTAYAAQQSIPGETLYAVKVHLVEEVIALTKTEPAERTAYDITLMETRLSELKSLAAQEDVATPETLDVVAEQIREHADDITTTLANTDTSEIHHEEKVSTLERLSSVVRAQEKLSKHKSNISAITEPLRATEERVHSSLSTSVEDFADEQPSNALNNYLSSTITEVGETLTASSTNETVRDAAVRHLNDANELITDGKAKDALISAIEAKQAITVDAYLDDTERTDRDLERTRDETRPPRDQRDPRKNSEE